MFFTSERRHFFKALTSKYREQITQCLGLLYQRQYSAAADYGQSLKREQVMEIFEEALIRTPELLQEENHDPDTASAMDDAEPRFRNRREQASWILKTLVESAWIERQVDTATFQSTFPFSRMGRIFTRALLDADTTHIRTRHRNTRNTLNALEAFSSRGDVYDLLDGFDYSERIITDFTDIITELEDRKRELIREVESQQLAHQATDRFFDYMEKRFQPDISVRLSADSVEKHHDAMRRIISGIRRKPKEFKAHAEGRLRQSAPHLCEHERSYLLFVLDTIEQRMRNASEVMLPALRRALHSFTRRADIIIRQLSFLNTQNDNDIVDICRELGDLPEEEYQHRISCAAQHMHSLRLRLLDPKNIKLNDRRRKLVVDTSVTEAGDIDIEARKVLMAQQLVDQAFVFNRQDLKEYVQAHIVKEVNSGRKIYTRNLPIKSAKDLLALAHIIEIGSINKLDSNWRFQIRYEGVNENGNEYYKRMDEFSLELIFDT